MPGTDIGEVILEVDKNETTLRDFIKVNVCDEPQLSVEELIEILSLPVGETWSCAGIHGADVKRIK